MDESLKADVLQIATYMGASMKGFCVYYINPDWTTYRSMPHENLMQAEAHYAMLAKRAVCVLHDGKIVRSYKETVF